MPTSEAPLTGLKFSLVGPGRVGTSLARWAVAAGAELVRSVGRAAVTDLASSGQALLLIAVPDGVLAEVAAQLAAHPQAAVALHTSGSRDGAVLAPLRSVGSTVGALHPLKAFPRPLPEVEQARGVFFGLDGDAAALRLARRLVAAWGGVAAEVPAAARPIYHFAATLAAGGVATLLSTAGELAARIGLPAEVARGYLELARGTVAAAIAASPSPVAPAPPAASTVPVIRKTPATVEVMTSPGDLETTAPPTALGAAAVLTGPVARGDLGTFERQVQALRAVAPERLPLAFELARETLRLVAARQPATAGQRELLAWIDSRRGGAAADPVS